MLEWTGERFLPWIKDSTVAYEHLHRYAYAATLVTDKRVLDLACGEGYGSHMLATAASSVVGVDLDAGVIEHAAAKYGSGTLQFLSGSITAVPIPDDQSFDFIVCFEAIEHIENQRKLLEEVKRLLKPEGIFMVSTPNKAIYRDASPQENPFHVKELYFEEFRDLLAGYFRSVRFLGQRIHPSSSIWPIGVTTANGFHEFVMERGGSEFEFISEEKRTPLYFIAIASDSTAAQPRSGSVLVDQSDSLLVEKDQETKWRTDQVADRDQTIRSLEDAVKWREGQIANLTEGLEWSQSRVGELEKAVASQDEALTWRSQQVNELTTAKDYWERESASLRTQLQNTQQQLSVVSDTLAGIYASRGWKLITKLRNIRNTLKGLFS